MKKISFPLIAAALASPLWLSAYFSLASHSNNKVYAATLYGAWLAIAFFFSRYFRGDYRPLLLAETFATTSGCIFLAVTAPEGAYWIKVLVGFLAYSIVGTFLGQKAKARALASPKR